MWTSNAVREHSITFVYVVITGTILIKLGPYCLQKQLFVLPQRNQRNVWLCLKILRERFDHGHCYVWDTSWEPSCDFPGESEIQMSFPVRRTRSDIKKFVLFWFGLIILLGSYWSSWPTFCLLHCGEVKIFHWAEWSCWLPSWLQFL